MTRAWTPGPVVFLDLETSGANPINDRVIEIGLIEVDASHIREWSALVNPGQYVSPFVTRLTGISDDMLSDAPTFADLATELLSRLRGRLLIAHNVRFDYGFLRAEFKRLGIHFRSATLCTVRLSRKLFPEQHRHNLDTLIMRHQLDTGVERHRALSDAVLLWQLWQRWLQERSPLVMQEAVTALLQPPILPADIPSAIVDDLPESWGAYAFLNADDHPLLVRRSANVRRDVLAHFAAPKCDERLLRETKRIDWREAAGELGARLQEKQLLALVSDPAGVSRKREKSWRGLYSWQVLPDSSGDFRARLVFSEEIDFAVAEGLFGLYGSHSEAFRAMRRLADAQRLCYLRVGLEEAGLSGTQGCSAFRRHSCRGVCAGRETVAAHGLRLISAMAKFRLKVWPYAGPVAVFERDAFGLQESIHLVDRWRHLATVRSEEELRRWVDSGIDDTSIPPFDADTYRVLTRCFQQRTLPFRPLTPLHSL